MSLDVVHVGLNLRLKKFLSVCRQRDRAHREIKQIFYKVIEKRRQSAKKQDDILQTLIDATYKYGSSLVTHFYTHTVHSVTPLLNLPVSP